MKRLSMLGIIGGAALLIAAPTTAVTSISRSMPDTARPLITRKVLAGIGPSPYASRLHFATSDW